MSKKHQPQTKPDKIQLARRAKICELAKLALDNAEDTKKRARLSIEQAIECGTLLIAEKMSLKASGIRGKWMDYFDAVFGKQINYRTAKSWMKIAADSAGKPIANITRSGMLALDLFPPKVHEKKERLEKGILPIFTTHLSIINKFVVWRMKFAERVAIGSLAPSQIDRLKTDFAPVIEFISQLLDGSLPEAQKQRSA